MMDDGMMMAELQSIRSMIQDPTPAVDGNGENQYIGTPFTPEIGHVKPFDLIWEDDKTLKIKRNVFVYNGEIKTIEDEDVPEGADAIWLKMKITQPESNEDSGSVEFSIEFEKDDSDGSSWMPLYKLDEDGNVTIDYRDALLRMSVTGTDEHSISYGEDGKMKGFYHLAHFYDREMDSENHDDGCCFLMRCWPEGADLPVLEYLKWGYFKEKIEEIAKKVIGGGSSGGGSTGGGDGEDGGTGFSGTVVEATAPRYDEESHRLLYTPVSKTYKNGRLMAMERGEETVIAQAVEESA